ncbi:glycosyltransferase family 90 protein [Methylobacterium currus]|uniref:glycosyltransferase family 90 protein n=1 Tax=Methylobacterium currus TaxID=2051553 RepID=UPI001E5C0C43|nr:glycosyltransferase family 90 protein [Methylobacterium currus]UHC19525.1 glycosyltransferase family 90 protein [Methylobacterium currus]
MSREEIYAVFRSLLNREPENEGTVTSLSKCPDLRSLIDVVVSSPEFQRKIRIREFVRSAVEEQLAPWRGYGVVFDNYRQALDFENRHSPSTFIYEITGGSVRIVPKSQPVPEVFTLRAGQFESIFRDMLSIYPNPGDLSFAVDVNDEARERTAYPVFSFQKQFGDRNILLPDFEFVVTDYLTKIAYDGTPYEDKTNKASFAGSTTGKHLITLSDIRDVTVPRIRAAKYFRGRSDVDFRLPAIVQCTPEAEQALIQDGFGHGVMGWDEAYTSKFIISMDGNGATCSRPAIIMRSRSVLFKYNSNHVLFWSNQAKPWTHYIPIQNDDDVLRIIQLEKEENNRFHYIAAASTAFAEELLGKDAILQYTSGLLREFSALIAR